MFGLIFNSANCVNKKLIRFDGFLMNPVELHNETNVNLSGPNVIPVKSPLV